jgi:hypothetical protein
VQAEYQVEPERKQCVDATDNQTVEKLLRDHDYRSAKANDGISPDCLIPS